MVDIMSNILVKCSRERCNNYRNENDPLGLCFVCQEYMLNAAERIRKTINKKTPQLASKYPYKTKEELNKYTFNICLLKKCKSKVFMRERCKKHYIEYMKKNNKK